MIFETIDRSARLSLACIQCPVHCASCIVLCTHPYYTLTPPVLPYLTSLLAGMTDMAHGTAARRSLLVALTRP
jgi:hypothetical protein